MIPEGISYFPEVILPATEAELLALFQQLDLAEVKVHGRRAKRKMKCFGWDYNSSRKAVSLAPPIPDYLRALLERCCERCGYVADEFAQAIVTWYPPGYGIGPHADAESFGNTVFGVSLGTTTKMLFRRGDEQFTQILERRALLVMTGQSRWEWTHEIEGRHVKETRWSVTYRSVQASAKPQNG